MVPCIDGEHIPLEPLEAIRRGSAKDIDVILGTSDDEAFGYDELYNVYCCDVWWIYGNDEYNIYTILYIFINIKIYRNDLC